MNPLQRWARNPTAYRLLMLNGHHIVESLEAMLRFLTSGRLGVLDLAGLPNVRITISGRKTGLARSATVQYVPFRDGLLLVGSNWAFAPPILVSESTSGATGRRPPSWPSVHGDGAAARWRGA